MLELTSRDKLHCRISGAVEFADAKTACALLDPLIGEINASNRESAPAATIDVSLAGVTHSHSVLVSLMLVWLRRARRANVGIVFSEIPPSVASLIDFTGLDEVLPVARTGEAA